MWVAGGSRVPDPLSPDKPYMVKSVMNRIARHADVFTVRASGKLEWVARDIETMREYLPTVGRDPSTLGLAHVQAGYVVDTDDTEKALSIQREPIETIMGTNRSWEHLQGCYLLGSTGDIVAKLRTLEDAGHRAHNHPARRAGDGTGGALHGPDHHSVSQEGLIVSGFRHPRRKTCI